LPTVCRHSSGRGTVAPSGVHAADYYAVTEKQVEALNSVRAARNNAKGDGSS
jgi:hypothetical protein